MFSGLDAESEEQVFNRLLGKQGLFQRTKTTVILITHAVHRLPYSDHVIAMGATGHIIEQGSFDILKESGGYVEGLATNHKGEDESSSRANDEDTAPIKLLPTFHIEQNELSTQTEELNRQTGDFQVYKYYFASVGWTYNLIFLIFVVLYGTGTKLTEFVVTYCKSRQSSTAKRSSAWLCSILINCRR